MYVLVSTSWCRTDSCSGCSDHQFEWNGDLRGRAAFFQYGEQQQESLLSNDGGWNRHGGQFRVKNTSDDAIIEADDRQVLGNRAMQVSGCLVDADSQHITVTHDGRSRVRPVQYPACCLMRISDGKGRTPLVSCRDRESCCL